MCRTGSFSLLCDLHRRQTLKVWRCASLTAKRGWDKEPLLSSVCFALLTPHCCPLLTIPFSTVDTKTLQASNRALHGKGGTLHLCGAAKAKLVLTRYAYWLAGQLRQGKTALPEPLPNVEPARLLAERSLLATKPLSLGVFVLRLLYCTGGPGLLRKLLALPTEDSPWVPVTAQQRRPLQSTKKRTVANPFSLLVEPAKNAAKEYMRMHSLASEVKELRTIDSKRLDRIVEALEALGARDGIRSHDNSVVTALVAASFQLKTAKAKASYAQKALQLKVSLVCRCHTRSSHDPTMTTLAWKWLHCLSAIRTRTPRCQAEQHRLEMTYGKLKGVDAAKTEEYLRSAAEDAVVQLVTRRFE